MTDKIINWEIVDHFNLYGRKACVILFEGKIYLEYEHILHVLEKYLIEGDAEEYFQEWSEEEQSLIYFYYSDSEKREFIPVYY